MILAAFAIFASSLALSAILCALVRTVAPHVGLIDKPDARKAHKAPTPLGGGVAIWLTVGLVLAAGVIVAKCFPSLLPVSLAQHVSGALDRAKELGILFGLATAIMILGLLDDRFRLGPMLRLGVQTGLAVAFVMTG